MSAPGTGDANVMKRMTRTNSAFISERNKSLKMARTVSMLHLVQLFIEHLDTCL